MFGLSSDPLRCHCFAFSLAGSRLASRLAEATKGNDDKRAPWQLGLSAPAALVKRNGLSGIEPYEDLGESLEAVWRQASCVIFIGALGIAARAVAPLLKHKSRDPAVLVLDSRGQYVISMLSGHWGGANVLARYVASLLGATPVITTESDLVSDSVDTEKAASGARVQKLALDLRLKAAGLRIIDWGELPGIQGALLEKRRVWLVDPLRAVAPKPGLVKTSFHKLGFKRPAVVIHWRRFSEEPGLLRVAYPIIHIGIGMRKKLEFEDLAPALVNFVYLCQVEPASVIALATVKEKSEEPGLKALAERLGLPIHAYGADALAAIETPNPSEACGRRFGEPPFSVCEAAALASARADSAKTALIQPKVKINHIATFAAAIAWRPHAS